MYTTEIEEYKNENGFTSLLDDSFVFENMKQKDFPKFVMQTIQMISRNSGIQLRFGKCNEDSHFNPVNNTIQIPSPPIFPKDKTPTAMKVFIQKLSEWRGVLNHEVGHALFSLWRAKEIKNINLETKEYCIEYNKFVDLLENGRM